MYLEHYGLTEKPFTITPNPRFVFLSKNHREVFAHLLYGIRQHAGFIAVTGEVGTGKTTVLRTLFGELEAEAFRIAYIFNPSLSALELLRSVNREFGLAADQLGPGELLADLNAFLLAENRAGRTVALVIDEAQNLDAAVLEQIRLLSNLETATDKLIQIVLVGQPELGTTLARTELRQLSQRITVRYHLQAMDYADTAAYVQHRLGVAGWTRASLFTPEALRLIYRRTQGNPRLINVLCDRALLVGYALGTAQLTPAMVRRAHRELRRDGQIVSWWRQRRWWFVLAPALLLALWLGLRPSQPVPAPAVSAAVAPPASVSPGAKTVAPSSLTTAALSNALLQYDQARCASLAVNALLQAWGAQAVSGIAREPLNDLLDRTRIQGFAVARLSGDLAALQRLDLPLLLEFDIHGSRRHVALLGLTAAGARIAPGLAADEVVTPEQLASLWTGQAWLLWRNPLELPVSRAPLRETGAIEHLQELLQQSGITTVARTGRYDDATSAAVRFFQHQRGLPADGIAGLQTVLALYQASGRYGYPGLTQKPL